MSSNQEAPQQRVPRASMFQRSFRSLFAKPSPVRCDDVNPGVATLPEVEQPAASAQPEPAPSAVQFEQFSREWKGISEQDNFDGFRIEAANQVTKYLQAAHTLFLGTQLRPEQYIYQFGPAFQTEDGKTMLVARAGLDGSVNGRVAQKFGRHFQISASSNSHLTEPQRNMHEGSAEYTGNYFAAAGKVAFQGAWLFGGAYTQRLLPQLQIGGDLTLVAVNGIMPIAQVGLRYAEGKDIFTATVNRTPDPKLPPGTHVHECNMTYVRKVTERLALGTQFKISSPDKESGLSMGYEYTFRQARVQGLLDTSGKVSCCVSDFVGFGFSGMIDYFRGDYKFGVVMHVLPPQEQPPQ